MENNEQNQLVGNPNNLHESTRSALQVVENKGEIIENLGNVINRLLEAKDYEQAAKCLDMLAFLYQQSE